MTYKLNIKAITIAEALLDKPFGSFDFTDEHTASVLVYAMYVSSTGDTLPISRFSKNAAASVADYTRKAMEYLSQFNKETSPEKIAEAGSYTASRITELANYLIINGGVDAHYVMYEMDIHEIAGMVKSMEALRKEQIEERRMWVYYTVLPQVGSNILKRPTDLITFSWEEEQLREEALKVLEDSEEKLNKFLKTEIRLDGE